MGVDDNYKRAVIKLADNLPRILETINLHAVALNNDSLSRNNHTIALIEHTEQLKKA